MNRQMLKRFFAFILCMAQLVTCVPCVHAESLSATDGEVIHNHVDASDEPIAGEAESQPEADGESQPEADGESQPEADGDIQPEADGESQPEADGEIQPEADGESQPEADGESQPEADGESQPEADGESQPEADGESQPEADGEDQSVFQPQESAESAGVMLTAVDSASCEHPNEEWWTDYMLIGSNNWQMEDARTHSGYARKVVYHLCPDCGNEWTDFAGEPAQMSENHSFDGDCVCTKCGYKNECEHPQAKVESEWHIYTKVPTENEDGKTHTGTGDKYTYYSCPDCGVWFNKLIEENVTITENHYLKNGTCTGCGYTNDCGHPNGQIYSWEEYVLEDGESWKPKDEHNHSAKASVVVICVCRVCGDTWEELKEEAAPREREHDFYEGVCRDCSYVSLCEHNNVTTYTWYSYTDEPTPDEGGRTHSVIATAYRAERCLDCGESDAYKETLATGVEYRENHYYFLSETCTECGYENPCEHTHFQKSEGYEVIGTPTPNADGKTHTSIVDKYSFDICLDCGWSGFNYQILATGVKRNDYHSFVNGRCTECYCENTCEDHTQTEVREWYDYTGVPTPNADGKTHSGSATHYSTETCLNCGVTISEENIEFGVLLQEDHYFENGMCWCGYKNECPHNNVEDVEWYSYASGLKPDAPDAPDEASKTHSGLATYYSAERCLDCGDAYLNLTITKVDEPTQEDHVFRNGVCDLCGYENSCDHKNTERGTRTLNKYAGVPVPNDDGTKHVGMGNSYTNVYCKACGETLDIQTQTNVRIEEDHNYEDGVCVKCGYEEWTCEHNYEPADPVCSDVSYATTANGHVKSYTKTTTYTCSNCGDSYDESEPVTDGLEAHSFNAEHVCTICTYECKHDYNLGDPVNGETSYTYDETGHTASYTQSTTYDCALCGDQKTETKTVTEPKAEHTLVKGECLCGYCEHLTYTDGKCDECGEECKHASYTDGVCDACKYVCTHEKTNSKKVDVLDEGEKWIDDGNQSTHSAKGKQNTEYVCAECSESWTEEAETSTLLTRKHSYKSGACVNCGAKKPSSDSSKKSDTSSNTFVTPILTPTPAPAEPEEMVAALTETVVQAEQEGASVTVDIVGAEEVFTPEHYEQVRKLPISEQILVTLASIGFEDVVAAAMQTMDVELSEEAAALMEQMNDTIEAMTDEERAEMQRKIEENFPKTEIIVDGVTYEAFVLELEINVDNKVRVERYSFRFDQTLGEWIFTKLDLVDAYVLREGTAQ